MQVVAVKTDLLVVKQHVIFFYLFDKDKMYGGCSIIFRILFHLIDRPNCGSSCELYLMNLACLEGKIMYAYLLMFRPTKCSWEVIHCSCWLCVLFQQQWSHNSCSSLKEFVQILLHIFIRSRLFRNLESLNRL